MSNWLTVLKREVEARGPSAVSRELSHGNGYPSVAIISQAAKDKYTGDLKRLQAVVEGAYMGKTVQCPAIGELPRDLCMDYQVRKFAATNPLRIQLSKSCKTCPNRREKA